MINMQCMLHSVTTRPVFLARTLIDFQAVLYKLYNIVQIQMTIISSKIQMNVRHYYSRGGVRLDKITTKRAFFHPSLYSMCDNSIGIPCARTMIDVQAVPLFYQTQMRRNRKQVNSISGARSSLRDYQP